jgi:hypothetical protein
MNSRFMNAVERKLLGQTEREFTPLVVDRETRPLTFDTMDQYRLTVRWTRNMQYGRAPGDAEHALRLFILELQEFLYGDVRKDMLALEIALHEYKTEEAKKILDRMRELMFGR